MAASHSFTLGKRLRAGETVFSGWCGMASPYILEVVAREGFNTVSIDGQHGLWDNAAIVNGIASIRAGGAAPIVRVQWNDFGTVSRMLDCGAEGIIMPMINNVGDAKRFVDAAKFPPLGERSWGPHRATMLGDMPDQTVYLREANDLLITFAMIETREALDNVDAIAAVPGIDCLFIGPSDMSITLSNGKVIDPFSRDVDAGLEAVLAACKKANKIAGIYCHNAERALACAKRGFRFHAVASDLAMLRAGIQQQLKVLKG